MMKVGVPRELSPGETRVALSPESAARFARLGVEVLFEKGLGSNCNWEDALYEKAGAKAAKDRDQILAECDILLRVQNAPPDEIPKLREGVFQVCFLDPFRNKEGVEALRKAGVSAFSMEMVPRSTYAQKMDALSSQHSIAGYAMVLLAADRLDRVFPMMMTPAGNIGPARVFIIGAGVAGLQAIATAKRMGARVEAFDTRPVVEEQVRSLGAKFVKIDLGETGQTEQGYAKELTEEQKALQLAGMKKVCSQSDVVITTAQLFGRPAPVVVTKDMLSSMRPGAIVVDYAVESGGNVEGSKPGEEVEVEGVRVLGFKNIPGRIAADASRMYANNLYYFLEEFFDKEEKRFRFDPENEIYKACLITEGGKVVNPMVLEIYGKEEGGA
ncbi:MAG TPA: NAD(P) transhydrogenase subunit alpha [Planctomycetes bacterium]|nr:NAD(P) transhydrogenase subunit alpha [Planctomycetota bacterium]